jgi:recombination protein RecA
VKVVKNKVAPPFRTATFDLMHDRGISREGDLINLAVDDKIIEKSGSWFNYGDIRLGQGKPNAMQYLRDNPALTDEISRKVLEKRGVMLSLGTPENNGSGEAPAPAPTPTKRRTAAASSES